MRYFATADDQESSGKKKKKSDGSMTEVEEQILGNIYGEKKKWNVVQHDDIHYLEKLI